MPNAKLITNSSVLQLSRLGKLHAWMRDKKLRFPDIADSIGCTGATARRLLTKDTAPSHRVRQLQKAGIPAELLPEPLDIAPGPKPKRPPCTDNAAPAARA